MWRLHTAQIIVYSVQLNFTHFIFQGIIVYLQKYSQVI